MTKYSPKLPLVSAEDDTHLMIKNIREVAKQNMKMVILTNPGERRMMPNFGVGIQQYLFENPSPVILESAKQRIEAQVEQFLPYINLQSVTIDTEGNDPLVPSNTIFVKIIYLIPSLNVGDMLTLNLDSQQF